MIKKVRHLQKAIIDKQGEVEYKDNQIQEKEKLYVDLRKVLARQPNSGIDSSHANSAVRVLSACACCRCLRSLLRVLVSWSRVLT